MVPNYICTKDFVFYTIQGEGRLQGQPSIFLRLSTCNLRCEWKQDEKSNLCDTAYSSHFPEKEKKSLEEILSEIQKYPCKNVVITGGEPFLQDLKLLCTALKEKDYFITIETNATIFQDVRVDLISMSPKLSSSIVASSPHFAEHQKGRMQLDVIRQMMGNSDYQLKFVVNTIEDLREIQDLETQLQIPKSKIYLMPQGLTSQQIKEKSLWLVEEVKVRGYHFCDRLHVHLWGAKRAK